MQRTQKQKKSFWKKGVSLLLTAGILASGSLSSLAATERKIIEAFFAKDKNNVDTGAGSSAEMSLSLSGAALLLAAVLHKRTKS